jgi:hypothetical protein
MGGVLGFTIKFGFQKGVQCHFCFIKGGGHSQYAFSFILF